MAWPEGGLELREECGGGEGDGLTGDKTVAGINGVEECVGTWLTRCALRENIGAKEAGYGWNILIGLDFPFTVMASSCSNVTRSREAYWVAVSHNTPLKNTRKSQ